MEGLNCNKHTLRAYYLFLKLVYAEKTNTSISPFLDELYDRAAMEFADGQEHHAANEYESTDALTIICTAEEKEHHLADDSDFDIQSIYDQLDQMNEIQYHPTKKQVEEVFDSIAIHQLALTDVLKYDTKAQYNANTKYQNQASLSERTYKYIRAVVAALCSLAVED